MGTIAIINSEWTGPDPATPHKGARLGPGPASAGSAALEHQRVGVGCGDADAVGITVFGPA